jgi:hypothetical protein
MWYTVSGAEFEEDHIIAGTWYNTTTARSGRQCLEFQGVTDSDSKPEFVAGVHAGVWQDIDTLAWGKTYHFKGYGYCEYTSSAYRTSGMFGVYHEIWEIDKNETAGRTYTYGSLPSPAGFLTSGSTETYVDAYDQVTPSEANFYKDEFVHEINVTGTTNVQTKKPFVRLCIYRPDGIRWSPLLPLGQPTFDRIPWQNFDDLTLGRLEREEVPFDDSFDGTRFNWPSVRTNRDVGSSFVGDHLNIDREFGLNITRRETPSGNPLPFNRQAPSSLEGYTTSGHMNLPTMLWWWPRAPSSYSSGDGGYSQHTSGEESKLLATGRMIVPSGRALLFDIKPVSTYLTETETEVTVSNGITNRSVAFIMPSGNQRYGTPPVWYDAGKHAVVQTIDIIANINGIGNVRVNERPLVADNGDITILDLQLQAETSILVPGSTASNPTAVPAYWHVCDVKMYECAAPFIGSGWNSADGSNIGKARKTGIAYFPGDRTGA